MTAARLALSMLMAIVGFIVALKTGLLDGFDQSLRAMLHGFAYPTLDTFFLAATRLGSAIVWISLLVMCLACFLWRGWRREAGLLAASMALAVIFENGLKLQVGRPRPEAFIAGITPVSTSFPSGHALFSMCFYGVLAWILARHFRGWRWPIRALAALIIGMVGLSRVYLGLHYPSDVLAGYIMGLGCASAAVAMFQPREDT